VHIALGEEGIAHRARPRVRHAEAVAEDLDAVHGRAGFRMLAGTMTAT
jgi:hypothetical protein